MSTDSRYFSAARLETDLVCMRIAAEGVDMGVAIEAVAAEGDDIDTGIAAIE